MLIDLRNSKGSTEVSAISMEIQSVVLIRNVSETCVFILHIRELAKVPDTAMLIPYSSSSPHFLLRQSTTIGLSYHCSISLQAVSTFTNFVLYHMWLCIIILQLTLHYFNISKGAEKIQ
jgi:hypothetical protein